MKDAAGTPPNPDSETNAEVRKLLATASRLLQRCLDNHPVAEEAPSEALAAMEEAVEIIERAGQMLRPASSLPAPGPGQPTRQQGQFLAFILEYKMRNLAGVAPTHACLQRYFNLTAPSVNSMLKRLEQRGFIHRIPFTPRAIELTVNPEWIPPLERPFKF